MCQVVAQPAGRPVYPAQRERAALLRSYASSPLSKANFCALKGMTEAALAAAAVSMLVLATSKHFSAGYRRVGRTVIGATRFWRTIVNA